MRYPLVLWDFDGTLADTLPSLLRIYNGLAARHGLRVVEDPAAIRDVPLRDLLRQQRVSPVRLPRIAREVFTALHHEVAGLRLFDGLAGVLREVRRSGRTMGVLSSNTAANIRTCLWANEVGELFDSVTGYSRLFGKARALRKLLKARAVDRRDVLYVGDEVRDVEAARGAGVAVAAVTWGFNTGALLARHGPDLLLDEPRQLLDVLGG
jgi:phosphoglycolate phosphatase